MVMEDLDACTLGIIDREPIQIILNEGPSIEAKDMEEVRSSMEILNRVDLDLAYSSEKLVNLGNLLVSVSAKRDEVEALAVANDDSVDSVKKALTLDHLNAILNSEITQLDEFFSDLHDLILDARQKISSCGRLSELGIIVENKLHDSEESLGQLKERILKMKMQIGSLVSNRDEWTPKPQVKAAEQKRVLRMLEKSLARELDLEKKITEMKQNEDDLKLKLRLREQVAFCMEEAAEVIWGRFLEAENTVEVLMGISKEMAGRLQIINFNLHGSLQREHETILKLEACTQQLNAKDIAIRELDESIARLNTENSKVLSLKQNIETLEQSLSGSESRLMKANASIEANREQIKEMESEIESLKDDVYQLENRAESAEAKVAELTETNLELSEELGFLKGSNDSSTKKASILEKKIRELELQLQHAKASSEAGQEQQNMLYSAIWDMETLIDELKQKVSEAENKTDTAEEQCIILSEANFELNKETDILRTRVEDLETSLNQATVEKMASAKDINIKTNFIMDLVMQLAIERERVQKQLCSLKNENKMLAGRLKKAEENSSPTGVESGNGDDIAPPPFTDNLAGATCVETPQEVAVECPSRSWEVEELPDHAPDNQTRKGMSSSSANTVVEPEKTEGAAETRRHKSRRYIYVAILGVLLSILAPFLYTRRSSFVNFDG
ncbi:PREDICTED: WPP domain-interacting tail-anchored protein 2-like [Ipomoea nil]|uniref:WPP domain-interacting tail-anchored protein 2-like n=1 Tax=Ipomoea nil TaxID=35883 RepID=UPI0009016F46|nr:PREDICTED: WPP domain-interacting tail-anchored protein 2-like [Ipomoea nil]XP_019164663.1 PREDICTED: WPP domain-interacting tail-anchored protein 2-like [Ipomoea nil]